MFPATWNDQQLAGAVAGMVDENVTGVRVVKAFGQEEQERCARLTEVARRLFGSRVRSVKIQPRFYADPLRHPHPGPGGILALGGWMALHHEITLGMFLAFSTYAIQLVAPVRISVHHPGRGQQARAGGANPRHPRSNPLVVEPPDAIDLPPVRGLVEFDDVHFGYDASSQCSMGSPSESIRARRSHWSAPRGRASRPSRLLLPRFYGVSGGRGPHRWHRRTPLKLESLRANVGLVFEEAFLFSDSVRANIAYGRPSATDEEVEEAARGRAAHDFITALPDGYDTVVGERGLTLSGGQRQRVSLARALLTHPRILVLDDATSSIDTRTEHAIHQLLRGGLG